MRSLSPEIPLSPLPAATAWRRVLGNLAHLIGGKTAAGLMSLVYLAVVAHRLGAHDYGVLVLVNGYAVAIGSLVAFSGFHGLVRYGAAAREAQDRPGLARLARFMALLELGFGGIALLVAVTAAPLIGPHLGWSAEVVRVAMLYSLAVVGTVRATPQGLLQIAGRFDLIGLHQAISPAIRLAGTLLVWWTGGSLTQFLLVWLLSSVAEGVAMWLLAWPAWRALVGGERLFGPWRGTLRERRGLGRFMLVTNCEISLRELAPNLVPLTIGWLLGPAAAGLVALAQRATNALQQPAVLIAQASYSVLADQVAAGRTAAMRRTVWQSVGMAGAIAALFVLLLAVTGDRLLVLLGGHSFRGAAALTLLVAIGRAAALTASPLSAGLTALGRPQRSMAVALFANLGLLPLLPPLLAWRGIEGAGWHLIVQNVAATGLLMLAFARPERGRT